MATTFLYTTDNSTAFILTVGKDEAEAQSVAEQAITTLPGVKLQSRQEITHSVVVNLSITMLSKAKSDDVLVRRLVERFKSYPDLKIALENEPHTDGSVRKKILIDGKPEILLDLKNPEQVADFENNGLGDQFMEVIYKRLEGLLKKPVTAAVAAGGVQPEISIAATPEPKEKKTKVPGSNNKGKTPPLKESKPQGERHAEKS
jgi:hypothetical protein